MRNFDYQINGLKTEEFTCDFWNHPDDDSINKLCDYLLSRGIQGFFATLITSDPNELIRNLKRIENFQKKHKRKELAGVHIEGGMISLMGVHPEKYSKSFDLNFAKEIVCDFPDLIKLWTLCPKMDMDFRLSKFLASHSITVSYGHSDASYDLGRRAFRENGVVWVTHWGNAMKVFKNFSQRNTSKKDLEILKALVETDLDKLEENELLVHFGFRREDLGIGLAALKDSNVNIMVICGSEEDKDLHLDPALVKYLYELKGEKLVLVSDLVAIDLDEDGLKGGRNTLDKHYKNLEKIICGV